MEGKGVEASFPICNSNVLIHLEKSPPAGCQVYAFQSWKLHLSFTLFAVMISLCVYLLTHKVLNSLFNWVISRIVTDFW